MKSFIHIAFLLFGITCLSAQDATKPWQRGGVLTVNFSNTGFGNYWQSGGINTIAVNGLANLFADYEKNKFQWRNTLDLAYGQSKLGKASFLKSDDRIEFNSKAGRKLTDKLLASAMLGFRTQFDEGRDFSNPDVAAPLISQTFAPAFINLGLGLDYQPNKDISIFFAPINNKTTIVSIERLRPLYFPKDNLDKAVRYELGTNLGLKLRKPIAENVTYSTTANFFSNYLKNFGRVDVNWDQLLTFQINKFLATTFTTSLIYDDDIRFAVDRNEDGTPDGTGARTQFKHVLGIGLTYGLGDEKKKEE